MARSFELVKGRWIGDGHPCFIIAEIGQNHQGDVNVAKELIKMAKDCGADCVKFQKSDLPMKFTKSVLERTYDSPHAFGTSYGDHKRFLEFSADEYRDLKTYATSLNIPFSASAMDESSLDFLVKLGVPFIKIGSGDANNFILLEKAAKTGLPVIYSTGMQDMTTVKKAMEVMCCESNRICILQCTSSYPTPPTQVHLRVMEAYRNHFPKSPVGYSGHEHGLAVSFAAVAAFGAHVIERHITLDQSLKGNDHACSLNPTQLKELVDGIRQIEMAMGSSVKSVQPSEDACHQKLGKSVVALQNLTAGTSLTRDHLGVKVGQPLGWPPQHLDQLIGRVLLRNVDQDETIQPEMF